LIINYLGSASSLLPHLPSNLKKNFFSERRERKRGGRREC